MGYDRRGSLPRWSDPAPSGFKGRDKETLQGFLRKNVVGETQAIYTDELPSYLGIADENTKHETVKHREKEYARGDVRVNSVENVRSLLKRSIIGSYHQVSAKYLDAYLDELEFRFDNRENPYMFREALCKLLISENLPYEKLVADSRTQSKVKFNIVKVTGQTIYIRLVFRILESLSVSFSGLLHPKHFQVFNHRHGLTAELLVIPAHHLLVLESFLFTVAQELLKPLVHEEAVFPNTSLTCGYFRQVASRAAGVGHRVGDRAGRPRCG